MLVLGLWLGLDIQKGLVVVMVIQMGLGLVMLMEIQVPTPRSFGGKKNWGNGMDLVQGLH